MKGKQGKRKGGEKKENCAFGFTALTRSSQRCDRPYYEGGEGEGGGKKERAMSSHHPTP